MGGHPLDPVRGIQGANAHPHSRAGAGFRPGMAIPAHRPGCSAFERRGAGGAKRFGRHEPHAGLAAIAGFLDALALDVLKKCLLYLSVDLPEAEVVLVDGELAAGDGPAHRHGGRGRRRPHGTTRRRVWARNGLPSINARRLHSLTQDLIFGNEPELSSALASDEKGNREIWLEPSVVNKLRAIRGPGESYSDVILQLAKTAP